MCQSNWHDSLGGENEDDHPNEYKVSELQASANENCPHCAVLCKVIRHYRLNANGYWDVLLRKGTSRNEEKGSESSDRTVARDIQPLVLSIYTEGFVEEYSSVTISIYNLSEEPTLGIPWFGTMHPFSKRSDSEFCFSFVQSALEKCLKTHRECFRNSPSYHPPKRLLSVGGDVIKLVEAPVSEASDSLLWARMKKYAALSHCWGPTLPVKTTRDTLARFKDEILWTELSATFQDGVTVARRLGLDWLWIDALCIIQHDARDWEIEAFKMSEYYRNAHVTIVAASSLDGTVPFLCERDPKWAPVRFEFPLGDSRGQHCVRNGDEPVFELEARLGNGDYANEDWGPLMSRAWTFQEHLLSTRSVHYASGEIIWDCAESRVSEGGIRYNAPEITRFNGSAEYAYFQWAHVIKNYTRRHITYESDRLPAVAGVAQIFHSQIGGTYLAGMWKENIINELCWYYDEDEKDEERKRNVFFGTDEEKHPPSWSWASINAPVDFPPNILSAFVTVVDAVCKVPGLNHFGQVSSSFIDISGRFQAATLMCEDPLDIQNGYLMKPATGQGTTAGRGTEDADDASYVLIAPDGCLSKTDLHFTPVDSMTTTQSVRRCRKSPSSAAGVQFEAVVMVMAIGYDETNDLVHGLVLGRSETDFDVFIRVGTFSVLLYQETSWVKDGVETQIRII